MKKKNLIILLLFPFIISVFCIATINTTYNMIDVDISFIEWSYKDMEAFEISDSAYKLSATGVNQRYYKVSGNEGLVWSVENKNEGEEPHAEIVSQSGNHYLKTLSAGEVTVTCSNEKGNVYRSMTAVIYKDAAIMLYPTLGSSQNNIDSVVYYGEYDSTYGNAASIDMTVVRLPSALKIKSECSDNISYDESTGKIDIIGTGDAFLTLSDEDGIAAPVTYRFNIVEDGVNIYTYEDLLNATNRSESGEIVVLRKHFESLENAYVLSSDGTPVTVKGNPKKKSENTELFGTYDVKTNKYSFADEIYSFKTTYNTSFIEQWNEFAGSNKKYSGIPDQVKVGLRVQKDFYGNGFTINMHNLTYPYAYSEVNSVRIPQLTADNLFRGPLKLYSLGDPNNKPLVSIYGQDNIGMYVDGDGITVNDVNLKSCDFGDRMANLDTVGTVLEVYGNNITIKNSRIANGKNVMRSFSSENLLIANCMLSNARNFHILTGANEYIPIDEEAVATFYTLDGEAQEAAIGAFLAPGADGDKIINGFLQKDCKTEEDKEKMRKALTAIQEALNGVAEEGLPYKGSATIEDSYFYRSGIASIGMETMFNSPFFETASPSLITDMFADFSTSDKTLVPFVAKGVSGISYPVELKIVGKTRFYDYKTTDGIEIEGLIEENITEIARSLNLYDGNVDIDTIFPMCSVLVQNARAQKSVYRDPETGKEYVNIPVAYYGGGLNLSTVTINVDKEESHFGNNLEINLMDRYLNIKSSSGSDDLLQTMKGLILKTVTSVTGFEPFKFTLVQQGYLFGETPNVKDLIANAKENIT